MSIDIKLRNIRISAISSALPANSLKLIDIARSSTDRNIENIVTKTEIEAVRAAGTLSTLDLCSAAIASLLKNHSLSFDDVDALISVTQTPTRLMPGLSFELLRIFGRPARSLAVDLNSACTGYIHGLHQAAMLISSGACRKVIVCTGDVMTRLLDRDDLRVRTLFGDAASATLLEAGPDEIDFSFWSDSSGADALAIPIEYEAKEAAAAELGYLQFNGLAIANFAMRRIAPFIKTFLHNRFLTNQDLSLLALHQANGFIVKHIAAQLEIAAERVPLHIADVGNTISSSIPLTLTRMPRRCGGDLNSVLMCGFGAGFSIGIAHTALASTHFIDPIDISETFCVREFINA